MNKGKVEKEHLLSTGYLYDELNPELTNEVFQLFEIVFVPF